MLPRWADMMDHDNSDDGRGDLGLMGGCACGEVRYRLATAPFDAAYCHCQTCRRISGAPVLAYASVPTGAFILLAGAPRSHRSSSFGTRTFCPACGTHLTMQVDDQPDVVDFTLASLDDPAAVEPAFHIWFGSRVRWFDVADAKPRFHRSRPDTAGA
jgi:hypothetical protein